MYDLKPGDVSRAIDVLRNGPISAADFSMKMWPDRERETRSKHSLAGYAFLYRMGALGYVDRVGDLWMVRRISAGPAGQPAGYPPVRPAGYPPVQPAGYPASNPAHDLAGSPPGYPPGSSPGYSAERMRLIQLVELAIDPLASVTHDVAYGNLAVRSIALDDVLLEACAFVVLLGRSANVYPPCGASRMIVGLSPAEGARALHVRWVQSGQPPELARSGAWITAPDGIIACPGYWCPAGASASWVDPEDVRVRVQRQRASAGLA